MIQNPFKKEDHRNVVLGATSGHFFKKKEVLTESELNHHVHIVGASGFGKTVLLSHIIKNKIQSRRGLLFIDLKGDRETIESIRAQARLCNRENDLQIFSLSNPEQSATWNPISEGTATQLRDKIMLSLSWSEEYYKNQSASFLLKALIGLCYLRTRGVSFSLETILKLASNKDYVAEVNSQIPEGGNEEPGTSSTAHSSSSQVRSSGKSSGVSNRQSFSNSANLNSTSSPVATGKSGPSPSAHRHPKQALEECYLFLNEKENFKSLQGLRSQLESLILSDFGDLLNPSEKDSINLFQAVNSGKIVCIFLDSRRYGESAKTIGRFLLQDLKMTSAKIDAEIPKSERKPFTVIIDEFADLAQEDFIGFLDRARSSKMAIVVAHQELSDLQRISKEFAARLIANSSTTYCFLQKNPESAELISGIAGTRLSKKTTDQTERFLWWDLPTGKKSTREVEEFIIHPNLIKSLPVGRCIVVKKYPYARAHVVDILRGE